MLGFGSDAVIHIDASLFGDKLKQTANYNLIDVRSPREYQSGHLPKAKNINVNSMDFFKGIEKLDKSKPTFVYCRSGARSSLAGRNLSKAGFGEVYNLSGGIISWHGKVVK